MDGIESGASEGGAVSAGEPTRSRARPALRSPVWREFELRNLALFFPHEIDRVDVHARAYVVRRLEAACRRMAVLATEKSHAYCSARHTALLTVLKSERKELAFLRAAYAAPAA